MYVSPKIHITSTIEFQTRLANDLSDTEIDWSTYMQQISLYLKGERDYAKISGDTGPLVYPGAHVWIYSQLYKITDQGRDVERAQWVFALVYLATLGVVLSCYRRARVSFDSDSFLELFYSCEEFGDPGQRVNGKESMLTMI
jgi:hypothetical protein